MTNLARAYVTLVPRFENLSASIEKEVASAGRSASAKAGRAISDGLSKGTSKGAGKAALEVERRFADAGRKTSSAFGGIAGRMFSAMPASAQRAAAP